MVLRIDECDLQEVADCYLESGRNRTRAQEASGLPRNTFNNRLLAAFEAGYLHSAGAMNAIANAGLSTTEAKGGWIHNYDNDGKKIGTTRWAAPPVPFSADALEAIQDVFASVEPAPVIPAPSYCDTQSLSVYPIPDAHIGMKAWINETGENYDLKIASRRLQFLASKAVDLSPSSDTAIVLGLGDMTHANDATNMTPRSKHVLDVDSRPFLTLEVTIAANVAIIEAAARKHKQVIVRVLPGNHDQDAYLAIMFALAERYRENPRVKVQKTPSEFFVFQHGKVMIAAHHGHGAKAQQLAMFMADEHAEIWGQTKFRHLFTGHLHHYKASDLGGIMHEQLRAIAPRDAYAVGNAYSARSDMQAITFDAEWGEVSRVRVPAMPEMAAA